MIGDILVKLANSESLTYDETEELRALNFIDVGKPPVRELSQISEDLGHVRFGSVICGTGDPFDTTSGNFNGMGIFNPPLSFTAGDFNLVGCNNGVLQAGISSVDGKFYAGGGEVLLDTDGIVINLQASDTNPNSIKWGSSGDYPIRIIGRKDVGNDNTATWFINGTSGEVDGGFQLAVSNYGNTYNSIINMSTNTSLAKSQLDLSADEVYIFANALGTHFSGSVYHPDGYEMASQNFVDANYVSLAGDTMTGALTIDREHTANSSAGTALRLRAHYGSGAAANGFGSNLFFDAETATEAQVRDQALIVSSWVDATDATRKARQIYYVYDTAVREAFRTEASGTAPMIGFLGAAAQARPTAYTQTYSTADRTHATPTAATLTDNSGGTANTTLAAVEATYTQATIRNNFADLAAMVNKNTADHLDLAQLVNSLIDDLQAYGLLQ